MLDISREAADSFVNDTLPLGTRRQTPQDYVEQVSATTGMPYVLVRSNMEKIAAALAEMERVLAGLTRGLDLSVLDAGAVSGRSGLSFFPAPIPSASFCPATRPACIRSGFPRSR